MVWKAPYLIYKAVETVFLNNVSMKSNYLVNTDHFPYHLI